MRMNSKKFFEPSWNKICVFFSLFLLIEFADYFLLGFSHSPMVNDSQILQWLVLGLFYALMPAKVLFGFVIMGTSVTLGAVLLIFSNALHLVWVYFLACLIDNLVKK